MKSWRSYVPGARNVDVNSWMVKEEIRLRFSSCCRFDCVRACVLNVWLLPAKSGFSNQHIGNNCWQHKRSWLRSIQHPAVQQKYATIVFSRSPGNPRPESSVQSAQVHLAGSWKELLTHAGRMDLLHAHVRVRLSAMLGARGWVARHGFTPVHMEGGTPRCTSWQVNSLQEGVLSTPAICCLNLSLLKISATQPRQQQKDVTWPVKTWYF